jgi:hypothetical protein
METSVAFYEAGGFDVCTCDGGYAFVSIGDGSVFDLDLVDKPLSAATNGAGCYVIVGDIDDWHRRLSTLELAVTPSRASGGGCVSSG